MSSFEWPTKAGTGSGTVTSVSVVTANGFAGTVATDTTTPAITLTTTVTAAALAGNGTAITAAHVADASHDGYLSSTDWNTFNSKQAALTLGDLTDVGTDGITIGSGAGSVIGTGTTISQHVADTSHNGYLSSTDWNTFNGKQATVSFTTFGSTPNANGGGISAGVITLQPADATHPGGVTTGSQTIAGVKTFSSAPNLSSLTASQAVVTDSSKNLASLSYQASVAGSTIVSRDVNGNSAFTNVIAASTATVSAAQTIAMNAGSTGFQKITGTSTVKFVLPDATTMYSGQTYAFNNNSTGNVTVYLHDGTTLLVTIVSGALVEAFNTDNSTSNGVWDNHWQAPASTSWGTASLQFANGSTVIMPGSSSGAVTTQVQAASGTYNFNLPITAGSAGQYMTSQGGGSTAMSWTTPLAVVNAKYQATTGQSLPDVTLTTIIWDAVIFDTNSAMNTSTGVYTVPVAGKYRIFAAARGGDGEVNSTTILNVRLNGTASQETRIETNAAGNGVTATVEDILVCSVNDTIDVQISQSSAAGQTMPVQGSKNWILIQLIA